MAAPSIFTPFCAGREKNKRTAKMFAPGGRLFEDKTLSGQSEPQKEN
jgi:hypothetical protein